MSSGPSGTLTPHLLGRLCPKNVFNSPFFVQDFFNSGYCKPFSEVGAVAGVIRQACSRTVSGVQQGCGYKWALKELPQVAYLAGVSAYDAFAIEVAQFQSLIFGSV